MQALYQKYIFEEHFPFNVYITDDPEFPPHWHEDYEIVYNLDKPFEMGINDEIVLLKTGDIVVVSSNDIHYFLSQPKPRNRIIVQFNGDLLGMYSDFDKNMRFSKPLIKKCDSSNSTHALLERQILSIEHENSEKKNGYKLVVMARLYDFISLLIRNVETCKYSVEELATNRSRLSKLEKVFVYVDKNYNKSITLEKISKIADYSIYHFTRFFKNATGMTFITYLNNYRIYKASVMLIETDETITEIAYNSGFESIKTFNRVFKEIKRTSPTGYRKLFTTTS